jgi:DNA-binding NarL/FixJ family response regulator
VIILSAQTDDVDLESLTTVGAVGVWAEQTAAGILAEAIREVRKGRRFSSPALVKRLTEDCSA